MSNKIIIKNAKIINEHTTEEKDILINPPFIEKIEGQIDDPSAKILDVSGHILIPGVIDDQVHFREPGLTHKADIFTESRAAVAGGITSFMDMPNTVPQTLTQELLENKYGIASRQSLANYSFYMGVSNDNLNEVLKTNPENVCGIKVFMGASTGNMLVDDPIILEKLFVSAPVIIAAHCEHEPTIRQNISDAKAKYGENIPMSQHPVIRSEEACFLSSSYAVELARKTGAKLHVLHVSTARELSLFDHVKPLGDKQVTAEVCIHHLWFDETNYDEKGALIKWNPAIKSRQDKHSLLQAVLDGTLDVIATDHAPHTIEEKSKSYFSAPSGGPLVQHSLPAMLEIYHRGEISLHQVVEKMCHNPAVLFQISKRGFIREGYYADLAVVNLHDPWTVNKNNIYYKCGWSPFEGYEFRSSVTHTFVSGNLVFSRGIWNDAIRGMRLHFDR